MPVASSDMRREDITALATAGMAIATFAAVAVGAGALFEAKRQIDVSQRQVTESHRPVLIGVADPGRMIPQASGSGGVVLKQGVKVRDHPYTLQSLGPTGSYPQLAHVTKTVLVVPVENIGSGPALDISAKVTRVEASGGEFITVPASPGNEEQLPGDAAGLAAGSMIQLEIHVPRANSVTEHFEASAGFIMSLTYRDVAGKKWTTETKWLGPDEQYMNSRVTSG
jgi:hypothetical protein